MQKLILTLLFLFSASNAFSFDYKEFSQKLSKSVNAEYTEIKTQLDTIKKSLDAKKHDMPKNPWIYYAMGDLQLSYIKLLPTKEYRDTNGNITSRSPIDKVALRKLKSRAQKHYMQAFYYHVNGAPKLNTKMLFSLYNFANDIHTKVEIHYAILNADEDYRLFGPNNTKVEFRRGIVRYLILAGEYEKALKELDKIEAEFPRDTNHNEWRAAFLSLISKQKQEK